MITELVKDNVWLFDDFLSDLELDELLSLYVNNPLIEWKHISNKNFKPIMADTEMSYRFSKMKLYKPIYKKLNLFLESKFNFTLDMIKYDTLNMQFKKFDDVNDHYALHAEDPKIYGDFVYILYLTNEIDGELVIPNIDDAKQHWSPGFQEMTEMFKVSFAETTQYVLPKFNRCVLMKTGLAHIVNKCSGPRYNIAGWPMFGKNVKT